MDKSQQLGEEKVLKLLLKFSVPAIIGMLVNALYNVVDRIFIGNGVGSLGIAGITIGFPIMIFIMACGMLIGLGATSLISIRLGQDKKEESELIMGNAMVLLIIISLFVSAIGLIFIDPLLKLLGASEVVLPYAKEYMRIILLGTVFQSIGFGMNNFIRAEGNPKIAMLTMLIGALLNMALDPLFIFVFNWGMQGAALATIISQMASAIWVLYHFLGGRSTLKVRLKNLKLDFATIKKIITLGSAPFAMQLAASLLNVIMNRTLTTYGGDIAISGMGVVNSITVLILMPIFGINQGVQPIIGYNYGAQKYDRVKEALKLGILGATIIVLLGFIGTRLYPQQIVAFFNPEDAELIAFGTRAIKIAMVFLPIIGFQIISANYFQAVGKPKQAAVLSLSRQVLILIPALLILPRFFGLDGALMAIPLADLVSSILTGISIRMELKNLGRQHQRSFINKGYPLNPREEN
ncbi:MATE family efflux transporter [Natronincola ferrireducens]|uniref:Multidrug export protein MepA n=1 Tax=Natronincola ferrireducens TaxID=393762 RepID=A0A1G9DUN8_9FIRM|nr:MATE family efflux transporter [Natronincola ferrireducens]SDK67577.1 putative efflux protein, MATE family [Natronincola ferrireducens]